MKVVHVSFEDTPERYTLEGVHSELNKYATLIEMIRFICSDTTIETHMKKDTLLMLIAGAMDSEEFSDLVDEITHQVLEGKTEKLEEWGHEVIDPKAVH